MGLTIVAVVGSLIGVLLGGLLTYFVERRLQMKQAFDEASFRVYMSLLEFGGLLVSVCSDEMYSQLSPEETRLRMDNLRWHISDELRKAELPELGDILQALHGDYPSEEERAEALKVVTDEMGSRVNPRYAEEIRKVSRENQVAMFMDPSGYYHRRQKTRTLGR